MSACKLWNEWIIKYKLNNRSLHTMTIVLRTLAEDHRHIKLTKIQLIRDVVDISVTECIPEDDHIFRDSIITIINMYWDIY